jgi:branched-chain amino acid transport system permease protein
MGKQNYFKLIALTLLILVVPLLVKGDYYLSILVFIGINSLAVMGLSLLMGYAGQISLGHAAFFGIGAYTSGILTTQFHFSIVGAFLIGVFISVVVAVIIGIPALRLKGHYLAVATLGIGEIVFVIFNELMDLTGGPSGLSNIPALQLGAYRFNTSMRMYYVVWPIVILLLWFSLNIIHSRVGRALRAMHGSEIAANAMGVNLSLFKIQVFVLSAVYTSIAGSFYAHFVTFIAPNNFGLMVSVLFLMMGVIGGIHNIWGSIVGSVILTALPECLRVFEAYDILVYGFILLGILLFMPEGLLEGVPQLYKRIVATRKD